MNNIKEVSEHITENAEYLQKQLLNLTGKGVILIITREKEIITHLKLEVVGKC